MLLNLSVYHFTHLLLPLFFYHPIISLLIFDLLFLEFADLLRLSFVLLGELIGFFVESLETHSLVFFAAAFQVDAM